MLEAIDARSSLTKQLNAHTDAVETAVQPAQSDEPGMSSEDSVHGGGKCDSGSHDMILSDRVQSVYETYYCNGCSRHLTGSRWFCTACEDDYCFECRPKIPKDAQVKALAPQLLEMGFTEQQVETALIASNGHAESALEILLSRQQEERTRSRRQRASGYGYHTVEYVMEDEQLQPAASSRPRRRREDLDEDWCYGSQSSKKRAKKRISAGKAVPGKKLGAESTAMEDAPAHGESSRQTSEQEPKPPRHSVTELYKKYVPDESKKQDSCADGGSFAPQTGETPAAAAAAAAATAAASVAASGDAAFASAACTGQAEDKCIVPGAELEALRASAIEKRDIVTDKVPGVAISGQAGQKKEQLTDGPVSQANTDSPLEPVATGIEARSTCISANRAVDRSIAAAGDDAAVEGKAPMSQKSEALVRSSEEQEKQAAGASSTAETSTAASARLGLGDCGAAAADSGAAEVQTPAAARHEELIAKPPEQAQSHEQEAAGRKHCITIERAKTARASCRTCGQGIQRDQLRGGMEGYAGGRTVMMWAHAECFLEKMTVEYVSGRRGKCTGSGVEFEKGDLRVGFQIGCQRKWWSPSEAAMWTKQLVEEGAKALHADTLGGVGDLEAEHRQPLLDLLNQGKQPTCVLRRATAPGRSRMTAAKTAAKPRRRADAREKPIAASSVEPIASAGDTRPTTNGNPPAADSLDVPAGEADIDIDIDADESDSDIQVDYSDAGMEGEVAGARESATDRTAILLDEDAGADPATALGPHFRTEGDGTDDFELMEE